MEKQVIKNFTITSILFFTFTFLVYSQPAPIGFGWTSPPAVTADTKFISDGIRNYEWPDISRDGWIVYVVNRKLP